VLFFSAFRDILVIQLRKLFFFLHSILVNLTFWKCYLFCHYSRPTPV